jgi:hypothetical protein
MTLESNSPAIQEKRRWPRYAVDVPVVITTPTKKNIDARATDLSEGGVAVYSRNDFEIGDRIQAEFMPPFYETAIRLLVVVRYRNGSRYGVEFASSSDAERQELALLRVLVRKLEARISHSDPGS